MFISTMPDLTLNKRPVRVLMCCTGVGVYNRGIETFFRECFDGLHPRAAENGLEIKLLKGRGPTVGDERRVWCLPRTGRLAAMLGKCIRRNAYVVEQLSSVLPIIRHIRAERPDVIFYSDVNLAMRLYKYRQWIGVPFRLIYSNGAPLHPPFMMTDHVQQVVPCYYEEALAAGEPATKHSFVPYGFHVPAGSPMNDPAAKAAARRRLGLPLDRPIVLSVGWIAAVHKRMDYTVSEIAALPEPRPYLVMLGAMDEQSPPVLKLANEKLGQENFTARSVPPQQVSDYYLAADVFVLSSLKEGFGRVYIEALTHGLPVVAHDEPVMRFVLNGEGAFADLSQAGTLTTALAELLRAPADPHAAARRRESVRSRFSWDVLAPAYADMFRAAIRNSSRHCKKNW